MSTIETTKLYKLTRPDGTTQGGCQWGPGVIHTAEGKGPLCTNRWLHAYNDPVLAVLVSPIHVPTHYSQMWHARGVISATDGLKVGCTELKTISRCKSPHITTEQRVTFAILCALTVYKEPSFVRWAVDWLTNSDCYAARSARSAQAAWSAAEAADAAWSSEAAARSARAAGRFARAAWAAADAAWAAADVAWAAGKSAAWAAKSVSKRYTNLARAATKKGATWANEKEVMTVIAAVSA